MRRRCTSVQLGHDSPVVSSEKVISAERHENRSICDRPAHGAGEGPSVLHVDEIRLGRGHEMANLGRKPAVDTPSAVLPIEVTDVELDPERAQALHLRSHERAAMGLRGRRVHVRHDQCTHSNLV